MDDQVQDPYTVVVGVSETSKSPTALRWAAAQAAQNAGRLVAVRALPAATTTGTTAGVVAARVGTNEEQVLARAQLALEADVAEVLGPDHGAEVRLVRGGHRRVLLDQAEGADLLVIDAPRRMTGEPLFAQRLLADARCPVVVMPPAISGQPPGALEQAGRWLGGQAVRSAGLAGRPGYRPPLNPGS